jgi:pyridoxine/pyridoxamine 5'-phosphate oxidase
MNNPIDIFKSNWAKAKSSGDANAEYCSLATISATGQASIRTLVLREVTDDSFVVFINKTSLKWEELQHSKQFELLVFWPLMMQQYRIRGVHTEVPVDAMRGHWAKKPYESKIIDHYYTEYQAQTSIVESRDVLLSGINELKNRYPSDEDVPFPENPRGISIKASYVEVWHGVASDRLHQRILYRLSEGLWEQNTLVP